VVAHSLTVVMLHLTGARRALASDPARADEALARAELVGRESLQSIRQVMGLLRDDSIDPATPSPGIAEVQPLIDGYRAGGLVVDAELRMASTVDPIVGAVIYRVIQESLTNALRHAGGSSCVVDLHDGPGSVTVEIVNGPGTAVGVSDRRIGLGLRGMAERVRALGGRFAAGPTDDGGWRVTATIPVPDGGHEMAASEETWPQPIVR
jgi:signal transduction histidine kinase